MQCPGHALVLGMKRRLLLLQQPCHLLARCISCHRCELLDHLLLRLRVQQHLLRRTIPFNISMATATVPATAMARIRVVVRAGRARFAGTVRFRARRFRLQSNVLVQAFYLLRVLHLQLEITFLRTLPAYLAFADR